LSHFKALEKDERNGTYFIQNCACYLKAQGLLDLYVCELENAGISSLSGSWSPGS
jgi:hypothetical protein